MKNNLKKILSFVLVAMMCISVLPISAFAAEEAHVHCPQENCGSEDTSYVSSVEADCLTPGGDVYLCNKCGKNFITNFEKALGHDFENGKVITPAVEGDGVCGGKNGTTAVVQCSRCDATTGGVSTEKDAHAWNAWTTVKPAVCGVSGAEQRRTCKNCPAVETQTLAVKDHTLVHNTKLDEKVDCDKAGKIDGFIYLECEFCDYFEKVVAYDYNHSDEYYNGGVVTTEPRCGKDGVRTFTCADCGATRTEAIPALDHIWDAGVINPDSTCTEVGTKTYTCTQKNCPVGTKTEEVKMKAHTTEHHTEVKGTCTTTGTKEYWYCTVCKQYFLDEACTTAVTKEELVVIGTYPEGTTRVDDFHHVWKESFANGTFCGAFDVVTYACDCGVYVTIATKDLHINDLKKTDAVAPDCLNAGNSEYYYCADCDKYFSDAEGVNAIAKDSWILEPIAHKNAVFVAATEATCGADGNNAYWSCADCGKYFANKVVDKKDTLDATVEIRKDSWVIDATGNHVYENYVITTVPTCSVEGFETGKCVCGAEDVRSIGYATDVHNFDLTQPGVLYSAEDCANNKKAVYTYTCTDCGIATMNKVADNFVHDFSDVEIGKDYKQANCTEEGFYVQICRQCHNAYNTVIIPAIGHDYDADQDGEIDWVVTTEPTCAAEGVKSATCKNDNCGHVITEAIPALKHTFGVINATLPNYGADFVTEATCQSPKLYNWTCTVCKVAVFSIYINDNTLGDHAYDDGVITTEPTCTTEGVKTFTCQTPNCGHTKTEAVAMVAHDLVHHEAVADTCVTVGSIEYWQCSVCNKIFSDADAKVEIKDTVDDQYAGHDHKLNTTYARKADCLLYGYDYYECTVCGDNYIITYRPLGHDVVIDKAVDATCTDTGLTEGSHCGRCNEVFVKQEVIPATGHENGITDDCTDPKNVAIEDRHCDACGKDIVIVHKHQSTFKVPANCCDFEYNLTQCDDCFKVLNKEITGNEYGDHVWNEKDVIVDTPATCTAEGKGHLVCTRCEEATKSVKIPKLNHDYKTTEALDTNDNDDVCYIVTKICNNCKDTKVEKKNHVYNTKAAEHLDPTYTTKGYDIFKCTKKGCNATKKVDIDALKGINLVMDYYNGNADGKFIGNDDVYVVNGGIVTVKVYLQAWEEYATNLKFTFKYSAADLTFMGASDTGIFDHTIVTGKNGDLTIFSYNDDSSNETIKTQGKDAKVEYVTLNFKVATLDNVFAGDTNAYLNTYFTNFASEAYKVDADKTLATTTVAHADEEIHIHKLGAINVEHEGTVDGADHIALMALIKAKKYMAEADIDMDGDVDTYDYLYLAQYNANVYTYAEFVKISG